MSKVEEPLANCCREITMLPPPTEGDPTRIVRRLVSAFCKAVTREVQGSPLTKQVQLVHSNRKAYEGFRHAIRATAPVFIPREKNQHGHADAESESTITEGPNEQSPAGTSTDPQSLRMGTRGPMHLDDITDCIHE